MKNLLLALSFISAAMMKAQMRKSFNTKNHSAYCYGTSSIPCHLKPGLNKLPASKIINMGCALLPEPGFQAVRNGNFVELSWTTCSESNCSAFVLQRSADSSGYETIALVHPSGRSRQITEYRETDFNPCANKCAYRLLSVTAEGETAYSKPVNIESAGSALDNSTDSLISGKLGLNEKEILMVLRDSKGNECYSKFVIKAERSELHAWDQEKRVRPGNYLVIAASNNRIYGKKIVVQESR